MLFIILLVELSLVVAHLLVLGSQLFIMFFDNAQFLFLRCYESSLIFQCLFENFDFLAVADVLSLLLLTLSSSLAVLTADD